MRQSDYDGAIDAAKKGIKLGKIIYRGIVQSLPNDLAELKRIQAGIIKDEMERMEKNQIKANIKRMRKENFRKRKLERRAKIKKFLRISKESKS